MKYITIVLGLMISFNFVNAQNINWASIDKNQQHIVYANLGYDFGMTTQLGYANHLNSSKPILL